MLTLTLANPDAARLAAACNMAAAIYAQTNNRDEELSYLLLSKQIQESKWTSDNSHDQNPNNNQSDSRVESTDAID